MTAVGLYAGSFDPLTRGHLDIICKAVQTFETTYVACARNAAKKGLFAIADRLDLIQSSCEEWENPILKQAISQGRLQFGSYEGISIIKYANQIGATHIVRGLRQAGDFNDEFALTGIAGQLDSNVIFTHFIGKEKYLHVSSSTARELASLNEDVSWLVTPSVEHALKVVFSGGQLAAHPYKP
jgi:pantetheine-phosphate adenylyltransferase